MEDGNFVNTNTLKRHSNINPLAVEKFRMVYQDNSLNGDDLFNYVYALMHSENYLDHFKTILGKEMPPIPFVKLRIKIKELCEVGRKLFSLHTNWHQVNEFENNELFSRLKDIPKGIDITKEIKINNNGKFF